MIMLRSLAFNVVMFGSGVVLSLCAFGAWLVGTAGGPLAVGQLWARLSLWALRVLCGIEIEVTGREHLPAGGAALIAAQHQSAFDTLVWLVLLPAPAYVLKKELLRMPLLGPLLLPSGFIAVDRAGGTAALRKMVADCQAAAAAGRQIVIFPEGTRVAPGETGVLQPGVVALAKGLNLPVIPVATNSGHFWGKQAFHKFPGRLALRVFPPVAAGAGRGDILAALARYYYETGVDKSVDDAAARFKGFEN